MQKSNILPKPVKLYHICPRDVRKNRADAVRAMYDCAGYARIGSDVTIVAPRVHRPEYQVSRGEIWRQYGLRANSFRIIELPTFYRDERSPETWRYRQTVRIQKVIAGTLLALALALTSLVRREPRLFIIHCPAAGFPFVLLARLRLLKWKCFYTPGGWTGPQRIHRLLTSGSAGVLAGNSFIQQGVLDAYKVDPDRVFLQFPYTYLELLEPHDSSALLSLPNDDTSLITYVGKIGYPPHDEIDLLLEAAAQLPAHRFVFVGGNGKSEQTYKALCGERGIRNTVWLGFQPLPDLLPLVRRSDVLVSYYSSTDSLAARSRIPAKFALYRCAGRPIVAADFPGMRDVLHADEAWFAPPDQPQELARTIEHVLASPEEAKRKSEIALARASESSVTRYCKEALEFMMRTPPVGY